MRFDTNKQKRTSKEEVRNTWLGRRELEINKLLCGDQDSKTHYIDRRSINHQVPTMLLLLLLLFFLFSLLLLLCTIRIIFLLVGDGVKVIVAEANVVHVVVMRGEVRGDI